MNQNKKKYYFLFILTISSLFITNCHHKLEKLEIKYTVKDSIIKNTSFVFIPKGKYTFGIHNEIKEINYNFWIMKYEVTNLEYFNFLNKAFEDSFLNIKNDTIIWKYKGDKIRKKGTYTAKILDNRIYLQNGKLKLDTNFSNHPVTEVTWFGATAYCKHYGFKLPDKFEWEKAARGMTGWNYPWGDSLESNRANYHNSGDPFDNNTTPVGFYNGNIYNGYQTKNSPSPYGCYDMAGNAWEYVKTPITKSHPTFICGAGGGFLYHTGAMCQIWYHKLAGIRDSTNRIDRPFKSDGFRCIIK